MNELKELHDAMTSTIRAGLPAVVRVEAFPDLEKGFDLPALFFGLTEFRVADDSGTGQTILDGRFQACILVDPLQDDAEIKAGWIAAKLAQVLRGQYWGVDFVESTENVVAQPDDSSPELASFIVWVVQWTQKIHVGDLEWPWPDQPPGNLVWGLSPDIGPGSEGSYVPPEAME